MSDDRQEERLDVLRRDEVALLDQRPGAGGSLEREARAHRRPERGRVQLAGRGHELDDPAEDQLVDVDVLDAASSAATSSSETTGLRSASG